MNTVDRETRKRINQELRKEQRERLEFIVSLIYSKDQDFKREKDLLRWQGALSHFIGDTWYGRVTALPLAFPLPGEFALADFTELRSKTNEIADQILGHPMAAARSYEMKLRFAMQRTVPLYVDPKKPPREVRRLTVTGNGKDIFLYVLFLALVNDETDLSLSRCPVCRSVFVKRGKQQTCRRYGLKCSRVWSMMNYRKSKNGRKAIARYKEKKLRVKRETALERDSRLVEEWKNSNRSASARITKPTTTPLIGKTKKQTSKEKRK